MKRLFLFAFVFFASSLLLSAQKSKVIGVFQLIENEKYEEAKSIIEEAIRRKGSRNWPQTWYAKGLLCQNAYRSGLKNNKENLYNLYPDQLYLAYNSFEEARRLKKRGRYDKVLRPNYVLLANDLLELGQQKFEDEKFVDALRAYKYALRINKSSFLNLDLDTNLLFNTALCAYKSKEWDDAIKYLKELNVYTYSSNVPHLLFLAYMAESDTVSACKVLKGGIKTYDDNEQLVLLLADLYLKKDGADKAIEMLNEAFSNDTSNYTYPHTIGMLYQKNEDYAKAIDAFKTALTLPSDSLKIFYDIGTCYYNIGAEINEKARTITSNAEYLEESERSKAAYKSAIVWFEKALELNRNNKEVLSKLYLLYEALDERDKVEKLESTIK